jgi:transcription initiation factor TFIIIB Brf1 subunit/transcription initiation factor TFIIB
MECPGGRAVFDAELYAYVCLDNGMVVEDKPIVDEPVQEDEKGELPALVNTAVHDYGIGTDVSRLDYSEARSVTMHHILGVMVKKLGLPRYVQADSARIIRELIRRKLTAGRRTEELIASVVYASARHHGIPLSIEQVAGELGVDRRKVWKMYKMVAGEFGLRHDQIPLHIYIVRAVSEAGVEYKDYRDIVDDLLSRLPLGMRHRKQSTLAEAILLLAVLIEAGRRNMKGKT